jgi:hypothetical protein
MDEYTRLIKKVTAKQKKTDADYVELERQK